MKKLLCFLLALVSTITLCFTLTGCMFGGGASLTYELLGDGTYAVTGITKKGTKVVIPASYNGAEVTEIAEDAFRNKTFIKEVVLPETVRKLQNSAFALPTYRQNAIVKMPVKTAGFLKNICYKSTLFPISYNTL